MKFIVPNWPAPTHIKAYTTLRGSLNPEINSGEGDKSSANLALKTLFDLPNDPIWLKQRHTNIALPASTQNLFAVADASFSTSSQQVCAILTADCLPVLICNKEGSAIAAIHAGWRGLANGVIEATIEAMAQTPEDLLVWLGPAIGPQKFEVGADVFEAFTQKNPEAVDAFKPHVPGKWLADLYGLAKLRLQKRHIQHIYGGEYCTYTQADLFHSYRRNKDQMGRMVSLIWIDK